MDDNFRKGFITGMAMNPLCVVTSQTTESLPEILCEHYYIPDGALTDDGMCVFIDNE